MFRLFKIQKLPIKSSNWVTFGDKNVECLHSSGFTLAVYAQFAIIYRPGALLLYITCMYSIYIHIL